MSALRGHLELGHSPSGPSHIEDSTDLGGWGSRRGKEAVKRLLVPLLPGPMTTPVPLTECLPPPEVCPIGFHYLPAWGLGEAAAFTSLGGQ